MAVVVAAIAAMLVGFVWNSPMLFERYWVLTVGKDPNDRAGIKQLQRSLGPFFGLMTVLVLVSAYVLYVFIAQAGANSAVGGMRIAFLIWVGFAVPLVVGSVVFSGIPRHLMWMKIWNDLGRHLFGFLAMGAILGAWR